MKKISLTIISMSVCLTMSGQQINHRFNSYRSGEMLMKQRVETDKWVRGRFLPPCDLMVTAEF